jgi:acetyl/propionyl-CoA carboxylase alpha subunit
VGVDTSTSFHRRVMAEPDFRAGDFTIRYLEEHPDILTDTAGDDFLKLAALSAALLEDETRAMRGATRMPRDTGGGSRWRDTGWR